MKKHLLITTGLLVSGMMVAQVSKQAVKTKIPAHLANLAMKKINAPEDKTVNVLIGPKQQLNTKRVAAQSEQIIGTTYYDLQSNSSVGDRIVVNADGSIAAVWTIEPTYTSSTYPARGTGYNYFDGSNWGAPPTARVENVRVGWGNVVNTRSGKDVVVAHGATAGNAFNVATRATKGTGAWSNSTSAITTVAGGNLWPRMVSSMPGGGDTIYMISISAPAANGGSAYNGLDGALLFSRSTDAGATWDITNMQPAGMTSANFRGFGGDAYAIAAKGSTVAIVAGDSGKDLVVSKSTDGGANWSAMTALKFPLPLWDYTTTTTDINNDGTADTLYTNDGTLAAGIDNNGMAYAFYGETRILNDAPSASGYSYFPYTDGLYMWNETMPQNNGGVLVAAIQDLGGDNTISFPAQSVSTNLAFGRYGNSLTSFPSVAWDANNIMYLSYSSVVDGLASLPNAEKLVRHVYITKSCDGGNSWSDPYDVVGQPGGVDYEGVYATMAKNVNSDIHIVYQRDIFPGYGVPPTSGTNPDSDNLGENNDIVYVKVPTVDIACSIFTGIKEAESVAALNFYPNPASTNGTIEVSLNENVKMDVVVLNSTGQVVYKTTVNGNAGSNKVDINLSSLSSGMYFYQVKMDNNKTVTKKFVVEK